jgi:predicted HNH restriction endonuclease
VDLSNKQCSKCRKFFSLEFFHKDSFKRLEVSSYCKKCALVGTRERHRRSKQNIVKMFGGKCTDCGGEFHPAVYDFHHTDPNTKEGHIKDFIKLGLKGARSELDKCVLLCANCHRTRHATGNL